MNSITLNPKRDYSTIHHHPWIFSGAVREVTGTPASGETVAVKDSKGRTIGYGSYSPASQIRVRMLSFAPDAVPDASFIANLVAASIGRRADFWVRGETNAFRLVNAENDGLPGVIADYYDGFVVLQLASAGAEFWKDAIVDAIRQFVPGCRGVYNRSDVDSRTREGLRTSSPAADAPLHKTGFYLDQRDARAAVGSLANGADMLNCFSYTGGFGLAARAAGALSVTHVDASSAALDLARRNTDLDHLCGTKCDYVEADVFKQLRLYRDQGRSFDMIVLDPPKFADTKAGLMRATRGYKDINLLAMKLLRPNGILATFSCSGAVTPDLFDKICAEAAFDAKRAFQIVARTRQASGDHPVSLNFPEGLYLKGLILRAV